MLINCLSEGLLVEFLSAWLDLQDIYDTDMAITSKMHREYFLAILKNVRSIRFLSIDAISYTCFEFHLFHFTRIHFVQWLNSRHIQQKLSLTLSPGDCRYLDRITYCFSQGKSYSVVSDVTVWIDSSTSRTTGVPLSEMFHRIIQVFPNAAMNVRISIIDDHLITKLLETQSLFNGDREVWLHMKVGIHSTFDSSWFQGEIEEEHSPLVVEFYNAFGNKIRSIENMYIEGFPFSLANIPFLVQHCPNLQAIPYRLNRTILSTYWQHLRHLSHVVSFELLFSGADMSEVGLEEEDNVDETTDNSVGSVLSVVKTYLHLKSVSFRSYDLSEVLHVFRHCPDLENFSVNLCNHTTLAWTMFGDQEQDSTRCSSLVFDFTPPCFEARVLNVALGPWAVFLSNLTAILKPLDRLTLSWSDAGIQSLNDENCQEYLAMFCRSLRSALYCRQLKTLHVSASAACFLGRSQCVFNSVTSLVLRENTAGIDASELMSVGALMMCVPNVKSLKVERIEIRADYVISWIRCLPSLNRLLLSSRSNFVTDELLAALIEGNRVWEQLCFSYTTDIYDMPVDIFVCAIKEQSLQVKCLQLVDAVFVDCRWGDGVNIIDSEDITISSSTEDSDSENYSDSSESNLDEQSESDNESYSDSNSDSDEDIDSEDTSESDSEIHIS